MALDKILLVENDFDLRKKYEESLSRYFNVKTISSGCDIRFNLEMHKPAGCLCDTQLDDIDGDEVFKDLIKLKEYKGLFILGMSKVLDYLEYWKEIAHDVWKKDEGIDIGNHFNECYKKFKSSKNPRRYKDFS